MIMPKAKKLPSGSWHTRVTVNGETISITGRTEKEVLAKAARIKTDARAEAHHPAGITVAEAVERYIKGRDGILSPSTIKAYRSYQQHRLQTLMPRRIATLTPSICQQAVAAEARQTSAKTVRNAWGLVFAAVQAEDPDFRCHVTLPAKQAPKGRAITPEELREIFAHVRGTRYELPILLDAFLGLRRSELYALRKSDFDFDRGTVTIRRAYVQTPEGGWVEREATKTAAGHRTIPVDAELLRMVAATADGDERLMEGIHPNTLYNRLQRITEACGMPHVRLHDFRHTFASVSHLLGIPEHYTMAAGGWASRPVLDGVYTHTYDSEIRAFSSKVADFFSNLNFSQNVENEAQKESAEKVTKSP